MNGSSLPTGKNIKNFLQLLVDIFRLRPVTRLSTRLLITLVFLSVIPLLTVGLFMTSVMQDSLSRYIRSQQLEIILRAGNEIKLFLDTPLNVLQTVLNTRDIIDMNPFEQNLLLNRVYSNHEKFNRIFTIDSSGVELTTTAFTAPAVRYDTTSFFRTAINGDRFISNVRFSENQQPLLLVAYPIVKFGIPIGVLAAEIDLTIIWDLVDDIRTGGSGFAYVVSRNGQLIAHPDKKLVLGRKHVMPDSLIQRVQVEKRLSRVLDLGDSELVLATFSLLENPGWIIAIQQPEADAFALVTSTRVQIFAVIGLVVLIAFMLSYLLEKRTTAPLNTLVDGVKRLGDGDLDFRIIAPQYEEIKVLANEFNAMAERLLENQQKLRRAERLAAMSKFATLVSHEIRNPLNSMNINMQILKRELEKPRSSTEKREKYFNIIISEIQRMDNLINNFLMISRAPRFDFLPNDIHEILNEVVLMHTVMAKQQKVDIRKEYNRGQVLATVDKDQMKQVFHNIIINALQAMPGGGKIILRTNSTEIQNSMNQNVAGIRIDFIDNGMGIPRERVNDIFEFYYTSKKTGTGLGLAIARQIIEGHRGIIEVNSVEKEGTTISITLPIKSEIDAIKRD
jgi:signal transduction histidine kinase